MTTSSPTAYTPSISFSKANFQTLTISKVTAHPIQGGVSFGQDIELPVTLSNSATLTVNSTQLGSGNYQFKILTENGYGQVSGSMFILPPTYSMANVVTGYMGGDVITITGSGISRNAQVDVAGHPATQLSWSPTSATYTVPPLVNSLTQQTYNIKKSGVITGRYIADTLS